MIKKIILIFLCIFITACDKQPNENIIKNSLNYNLQNKFENGLFTVEKLIRRGTAIDSNNTFDKTRRIVYYDVILKIHHDIQPSTSNNYLNDLMYINGSGSRGIIGMKPDGNHIGDLIKIHGSAIFSKKNGYWEQLLDSINLE
ncbi:hypothetical protein CKSOR_00575 [Candidatus Kinetoplastibacterium sorsogonicusi]|uniref:Lipoprotein n=1 Tax=Candidatus Kinetoplastidibacterium kentomonadis TaxID=1576550 RepID=A0A3S7JAK8_9PROT|nr:hypothetical protein [Candidatus Kinetoplastibacterium sorsogonicusi]AWD32676.1 hypothetical protein CKSOR_00575 [Candidatus Kinetoplastibacterium sorsogonicusi]